MSLLVVEILESEAEITRRIMRASAEYLNTFLSSVESKLLTVVQNNIRRAIEQSPEWNDLRGGNLQYELGIPNPESVTSVILNRIVDSVRIEIKKVGFRGSSFTGGVYIYAIPSDYTDLISMQEAKVITEKGVELDWLNWLLTGGSNIIIGGYDVSFVSGKGRTGNAVMVQGGDWAVPSRYQGSSGENFITRALEKHEAELIKDIIECMI